MGVSRRFVAAVGVVLAIAMVTSGCTKKGTKHNRRHPGGASASAGAGSTGAKVKVAFVPKLQGSRTSRR